MTFIRATAVKDGAEITVAHEAPPDPSGQGRKAVGYLKPSGETYVHPMYAFAKSQGVADEAIRESHKGVDGQGNENVSDQRWIYDLDEAATLKKQFPERFVETEG